MLSSIRILFLNNHVVNLDLCRRYNKSAERLNTGLYTASCTATNT